MNVALFDHVGCKVAYTSASTCDDVKQSSVRCNFRTIRFDLATINQQLVFRGLVKSLCRTHVTNTIMTATLRKCFDKKSLVSFRL